ncbi:unnamed protein product [Rotaria sordida]|uniref:PH domain-containing protein n=1 Tax=Rotaria sordida TaxID=392033 RepID=A0A814ZN28_9BILA|nr:unnamed protein product [Rotaria sordida]CAF3891499.1 unnamed protein product [Rotaria sordida]
MSAVYSCKIKLYVAPPSTDTDYQVSPRYGVGDSLTYTDEAYEPTKSHPYGSALNNSTSYTSPTSDNLAVHSRQQHFSSTTNLNVNGTLSRRQQQQNIPKSSFTQSTPYLSQIRDDDPSTFKSSSQQKDQQRYTDRHSIIGSDSGIVIVHGNQPRRKTDDNQIVEKKLTNLVQKLGRQLETDTQHLSEKLESKLKNLEHMINQQTFVIREQDGVIEHLKTKISKIETERDTFRDRLSVREHDDKKNQITTEIDKPPYYKTFEQDDEQQTLNDASTNRKFSNSSSVTTDQSKRSSKKLPAPRIDRNESFVTNEDESTIAKLINTFPSNPEPSVTDSSNSSVAALLVGAVPLIENPPAANRLDTIIRQTSTDDTTQPTPLYYNQIDNYPYDFKQSTDRTTPEPEELFTNVRDDDEQIGRIITSGMQLNRLSSSLPSSASTSIQTEIDNLTSTNNYTLPTKNSNIHRSLDLIPRKTPPNEEELRPATKTTSLELYQKPVPYDEPALVFLTPQEPTHAASQYQNVIKGWLRKQNRASILKRVERYYCVLWNDTILMHKQENDRAPKKRVILKGAKVHQYDDQKYGPSLELTWSPQANRTKRYHLYFINQHEAQQWLIGIQNAMDSLSDNNRWQQYRITI